MNLQVAFEPQFGNRLWDGVLRSTGVIALLAIPPALFLPASITGLIGFVIVTILVNGPLGIFLPATYEPILMLFGRLYAPLLIAMLGISGTLYVEFLNYHLFAKVLYLDSLRGVVKGGGGVVDRRTVSEHAVLRCLAVQLVAVAVLGRSVPRPSGALSGAPLPGCHVAREIPPSLVLRGTGKLVGCVTRGAWRDDAVVNRRRRVHSDTRRHGAALEAAPPRYRQSGRIGTKGPGDPLTARGMQSIDGSVNQ